MAALTKTHPAIETFLEEQAFHGRSDRTIDAYEHVLRDFWEHVADSTADGDIASVERRACMRWVHGLRGEHKPSTIASYASYVNRFYGYMVDIGEFDSNPMRVVIDQMSESIETDPLRRDISLDEMRKFVATCQHPLTRAILLLFLKTGIRVGELCNLDLRDVTLSYGDIRLATPNQRGVLDSRSNALYVTNSISVGDVINGEERSASNKRQRETIIPIDRELGQALLVWLAIRPDSTSDAEPLFVDTNGSWGERITPASVRYRIKRRTEPYGWHSSGGSAAENVTPHYFRHFFTTHLRDRTGDRGIVKYLRGDVADDIIDTYTHNWGERVRQHYLDNIYVLT